MQNYPACKELTLEELITNAADILISFFFFSFFFFREIRLDSLCELTIHMKCQNLFSLKKQTKKLECHLLQFCLVLYGVNWCNTVSDSGLFFFFF